ncbi:oligopeptide/dipeptide ABC transporter ATP-binding protein [Microvirga ossetica]|uniref:oligopeptide/dipeptide ABC transporter ATP-binding protein n=1 Tax=Microvirga ossetica TaxID=1882682 RepID=UPI000C15EC4F|nr:oligopeptide/dipeptide ABC transporter ATP-binding protein [Microvirga ossetica]
MGAEVVETGETATILSRPTHPYTKGLLASLPRLAPKRARPHRLAVLAGQVPDLRLLPGACAFSPSWKLPIRGHRCAAYDGGTPASRRMRHEPAPARSPGSQAILSYRLWRNSNGC